MTERSSRIQALLNDAVTAGQVPGVTFAAVLPDGEVISAAAGVRDTGTATPMNTDTVVWIASMTKAITSAAAMKLVEQGKLSLDDPIAAVLPALADVPVLDGFTSDGTPNLRPAARPITLRHLLTHSSGFVYEMWSEKMRRYLAVSGKPSITTCANAALELPLAFDPGSAWDYGIGIDWAGKAVEAASGQKLGAYLHDNIFAPLGMNDTVFRLRDDQRARLARVHARTPDGTVPINLEIPQEPEFQMGGGGLYATVGDYLRFARMILGGGTLDRQRILAPETVSVMSRNAMGDLRCRAMKSTDRGVTNDVDFVEGMEWGLSFLINPEPMETGRSAGSLAWAGLANSYFWIDPKRNVAGVYATQILPFLDAASVGLFGAAERAVYDMA